MKKIVLFVLLAFLASCQSTPKKSGKAEEGEEVADSAPEPIGPVRTPLFISTYESSRAERDGKELLEKLTQEYDLTPFFFSKKVEIHAMVPPHSHPIVTLNTYHLKNPDRFLANFIHEQIHWFFSAREMQTRKFMDKMKAKFPKVPAYEQGGAKDELSTYLHFGVVYYALEQLSRVIGKERALANFKKDKIYRWIRAKVLENMDFIRDALNDSGLQWKDAKGV